MAETTTGTVSEHDRENALNAAIAEYAREGWTISSVFAGQAVAQRKERVGTDKFWINGIFWTISIILVFVTGGIWLGVIAIWYLTRKNETVVLSVDEAGHVTTS